jgi:glucosyl-dolichyl phosphate glucuronosyltransferase
MQGDPAVTVIVPTRNRSSHLHDCLGSLARQRSARSFEVIVVDNGSSDDTPRVVARWCREDPRFRAAHEPRPGLSRAKNAGVEQARGELLLFTDDDAIVQDGWIDAYVDLFGSRDQEVAMAGGPVIPVPEDLGSWPHWFDRACLPDLGLLDLGEQRSLEGFEYVWGGNLAIRASAFDRFGRWDESLGRRADERGTFEDAEYQDRLRQAGGKVWFCPRAVVHHRLARGEINPRRVLRTAFARGRNDYARESLYGDAKPPHRGRTEDLARLAGNLSRWLWWATRFRASESRDALERARTAAWESGWTLDSLRSGREEDPLPRAVARLAFRLHDLALRLTPDRSTP